MTNAELHELAVATDTQLADLYEGLNSYFKKLDAAHRTLGRELRLETTTRYGGEYRESLEEMIDIATAKIEANDDPGSYVIKGLESSLEFIEAIKAQIADTQERIKPLSAIYSQHKWSRFFLVDNTNGHIHSTMNCSTCFHDTRFGWLPQLSGLTEQDAVEAQGEILCSICYPSAPVAWTNGVAKKTLEERQARDAQKQERDAKKAAKAIYDPVDGSVLKAKDGYEIKTLVTAQRELSNALQYEYMEYGDEWTIYAVYLANAIAAKTGANHEELLKTGRVKAQKKIDAERKKYAR